MAEEAATHIDRIVQLVCSDSSPERRTEEHSTALKKELKELGREYMDVHSMRQETYHSAQAALLTMLAMGLQSLFTNEVKESWEKFAKFTREAMISDNYERDSSVAKPVPETTALDEPERIERDYAKLLSEDRITVESRYLANGDAAAGGTRCTVTPKQAKLITELW